MALQQRDASTAPASGAAHSSSIAEGLAIVLLTGVLAAFGTAPIPAASLFMLSAVMSAVALSPFVAAMVMRICTEPGSTSSEMSDGSK